MKKLRSLWHRLTKTNSVGEEETRREYMTKVILVILSTIAGCFVPLFFIIYGAGVLPIRYPVIITIAGLFISGGLWLAHRGHWRVSSYIPPLVFFLTAIYGQYLSGMGATTTLFYAVVVLLITMLQGSRVQWSALVFSLGTYVAIGGARAAGHLAPAPVPMVEVIPRSMTASIAFVSFILLLRLFTVQFQQALKQSRVYANELKERKDTLEEQVAARTRDISRMAAIDRRAREELEKTVMEYSTFAQRVAQGDLREGVSLGSAANLGVLGQHLNDMVTGLRELATQTVKASQNISAAAGEIHAVTVQQTASTERQATSIARTVSTATQIKTIAEQLSERAHGTASAATQAQDMSQRGLRMVDEMVQGMAGVQDRVKDIAEMVVVLSTKTQQISEIISTVDQIATQSDMLALNAAIEAARAGESGKGFEIVAQEVRSLAERSQIATTKVRRVLRDIQGAIKGLITVVENAGETVTLGSELALQSGEVINELGKEVDTAARNAEYQLASSRQQVEGVTQVTVAMEQLDNAMQQMVSSVQQTERATQDLNTLAQQMTKVVSQYQLK